MERQQIESKNHTALGETSRIAAALERILLLRRSVPMSEPAIAAPDASRTDASSETDEPPVEWALRLMS